MANKHPYAWDFLKGLEILHHYWGFCRIEEISQSENSMILTRYELDMERVNFSLIGFRDEVFATFTLPVSLEIEYEFIATPYLILEEEAKKRRYADIDLKTPSLSQTELSLEKLNQFLELQSLNLDCYPDDFRDLELGLSNLSERKSNTPPTSPKARADLIKKSCENMYLSNYVISLE